MDNVISEQSVINTIHKTIYSFFDVVEDDLGEPMNEKDKLLLKVNKAICNEIKKLPPAQPGRKKGEWLPQDHNKRTGYVTTTVYYYPKCSECGHTGNYWMNYCPSCGADMRGKQNDSSNNICGDDYLYSDIFFSSQPARLPHRVEKYCLSAIADCGCVE